METVGKWETTANQTNNEKVRIALIWRFGSRTVKAASERKEADEEKRRYRQQLIQFYMAVQQQIKAYIDSQPEPKRSELQELHRMMLQVKPTCKLWFLDGKDAKGKIVSNPNIGYGQITLKYTKGETREFYQIGLSANTTGISVYIMGIDDKKYLAQTFGKSLGKASVTGYCIKFKTLNDINVPVLEEVIRFGFENR